MEVRKIAADYDIKDISLVSHIDPRDHAKPHSIEGWLYPNTIATLSTLRKEMTLRCIDD